MMNDPVLIAYGVSQRANGKRKYWRRIGEAYSHEDGAGLTVLLNAVPRDGRIILLERDAADDAWLDKRAKALREHPRGHSDRSET